MVRFAISAMVLVATFTGCGSSAWWSAAEGSSRQTRGNDKTDARAKADKPDARAKADKPDARADAIARAQIWTPTDVPSMDVKAGPKRLDSFPFRATLTCDYLPKELSGASPKFACRLGDEDEIKVKFGGANAEVYAEVAATRLLWALGFPSDQMYPVKVICRRCPATLAGMARDNDESVFDPATVERKLPGREFPGEEGWAWNELDTIDEKAGGAPRAHRDALRLLAVLLQHTDTKPQQQRLLCLDDAPAEPKDTTCLRPLMMVNDLGLTFGRANTFNLNEKAMNLVAWSETPVWKGETGCVGNLPKSFTGTLDNPVISEEGRQFLTTLLNALTDAQLRDIFETARVTLRTRDPLKAKSGFATVEEWVSAFKQKRSEIANRRC
jgi:hypothetical protein